MRVCVCVRERDSESVSLCLKDTVCLCVSMCVCAFECLWTLTLFHPQYCIVIGWIGAGFGTVSFPQKAVQQEGFDHMQHLSRFCCQYTHGCTHIHTHTHTGAYRLLYTCTYIQNKKNT